MPIYYSNLAIYGGMGFYLASKSDNKINKVFFYTLPVSSVLLSILNMTLIEKYSVEIDFTPVVNDSNVDGGAVKVAYTF